MTPSPLKWKRARPSCVGWCLLCCVWGRCGWAAMKFLARGVGHLRLTLLERDAPHFHAVRKPCFFQATAANPSSVFPLVVAKTEMCCNEYKGSPLWRWLNAYRPCNSHWLSSFQTGCLLLPHKVSLILGLASVARKGPSALQAEEKMNPVFCALSVVHCVSAIAPCARCWMQCAARRRFWVGVFWLFSRVSYWHNCQCWCLLNPALWIVTLLCCLGRVSIRIWNWKFITWNCFLKVKLTPVSYYLPSPEGSVTFLTLL